MNDYKGKLVSVLDLVKLIENKPYGAKIVIRVMPKKQDGDFSSVEYNSNYEYLDTNMLAEVNVSFKSEEQTNLSFNAQNFEMHNLPYEKVKNSYIYHNSHNSNFEFLTFRERKTRERMSIDLYDSNVPLENTEKLFVVDNYEDFIDKNENFSHKNTLLKTHKELLEISKKSPVQYYQYIGYLGKKSHLKTITDDEKKLLKLLLAM